MNTGLVNTIPVYALRMEKAHGPDYNEIVQKADLIFGSHEKARAWLYQPDSRLHGLAPIAALDTEDGCRTVEKMLWQIDEGIYD